MRRLSACLAESSFETSCIILNGFEQRAHFNNRLGLRTNVMLGMVARIAKTTKPLWQTRQAPRRKETSEMLTVEEAHGDKPKNVAASIKLLVLFIR